MLKATIILFIIAVIILCAMVFIVKNMSIEEKLKTDADEEYPTRLTLLSTIWIIDLIAFIVCLVITIIKW